ncbi:DNA polymerase III subunit gamma and tau [Streptomyces pluripotens]|uniref:DNA polymerase III subunit gamma/tau n=1 Tax=Streptomyces pluripotens TaxID=1355015 RepID=A0A221P0P6_9ACTN|nr:MULTISPECIES: DNA polymerase III subunit gamma and tau [Streptomyces]ARP71356.1 DNA polymerase III subunit gamma and tau [Streptomyces pluripotens]ASN25608.1 DNA polymerase III subunit gamma and tau [Streptomyces pluripotens]MCH0561031.1 DNA polymerase III subunit gamma and tau [Streptomyces sp. MUM 16J]
MSSLALYRRYRPETFAEVIGQEHVTDPLQQALRNNRVNHAYLFSGPRGCGKTTSARILARCLNCEQGPTATPCGECLSCRDLARNGPGSIDVIEIDAASHGGVDDARELREKAFFGPASSRYKIYIIDEAHMVTSAGFNALLKVVEEPPEHLKFIFATTEPEKVIGTIRSRTHHYPFRLVPPGTLRDYLADVCGRESIPVEEGVLPLVVRAGAGSVRDSMSVMDQLLAGAGAEGVTYAMATALLGYTDGSLLDSVVEAFATGDGAVAFEVVDRVIEGGNDPRRFVADLLERLRDLVILAAVPDATEKGLIDAPVDVLERMQAQASTFGAAELSRAADLVNEGLTEMRGATSPRLQLELICARVLLPAAYGDERSVLARLDRLERGVSFSGGAGAPAMGYTPDPEAHVGGAPVPPGGGPAAVRAAVRGAGAPGGGGAGAVPATSPPAEVPAAPAASDPVPASTPTQAPAPARASVPGAVPGAVPASTPAGTTAPAPAAQPPSPPTAPPAAQAPGAWPTAAPAGSGRRPGGWPTAAAPAPGAPQTPAPGRAPASPQQQVAPAVPAPAQAAPTGGLDPRALWPNILEAVKNRRRFTWILLSQNAQVAGFDGTTLHIGFVNAGARDNFAGSGSEDVLRQALAEQFHVHWKIEAVVDPSGGSAMVSGGASGSSGGYGGPPAMSGSGGYGGAQPGGAGHGAPAAPRPSAPRPPSAPPQSGSPAGLAPAAPQPARASEPPPVAPEDDIPEDDDPDLDESALSGHELIVRELGATVVEEFSSE